MHIMLSQHQKHTGHIESSKSKTTRRLLIRQTNCVLLLREDIYLSSLFFGYVRKYSYIYGIIKTKTMSTTSISYQIRIKGSGTLPSSQYSKYNERFKAFHQEKIQYEEIYGPEQAREHLKEIRQTEGAYAKYWSEVELSIEKVICTVEIIEL